MCLHPRRNTRKRLLIEMVDTTFLIQFKTPGSPGTAQPVIAARAEVRGQHLSFCTPTANWLPCLCLENVMSWS